MTSPIGSHKASRLYVGSNASRISRYPNCFAHSRAAGRRFVLFRSDSSIPASSKAPALLYLPIPTFGSSSRDSAKPFSPLRSCHTNQRRSNGKCQPALQSLRRREHLMRRRWSTKAVSRQERSNHHKQPQSRRSSQQRPFLFARVSPFFVDELSACKSPFKQVPATENEATKTVTRIDISYKD